jgi:hypothetical protein
MFMPPEARAALWSEMLVQLLCFAVFCYIGYVWIPDVDDTLYPKIGTAVSIYLFIGSQLLYSRGIYPPASAKIRAGKMDLRWGWRVLYWQCWWPMYWRKK